MREKSRRTLKHAESQRKRLALGLTKRTSRYSFDLDLSAVSASLREAAFKGC
jgi:hypothetical protein